MAPEQIIEAPHKRSHAADVFLVSSALRSGAQNRHTIISKIPINWVTEGTPSPKNGPESAVITGEREIITVV